MKIRDLIAALSQFDPEQRVIVHGWEGGFDDIGSVQTLGILVDEEKNTKYFGPHSDAALKERKPDEVAILLAKKRYEL